MEKIELLFQDENYTVCIKPSGINSEDGKSPGMPSLLSKTDRPLYTVHRLDKEVSGVMVYANSKKAAADLSFQIANRSFKKEYLAVVSGNLPEQGAFNDFLYHDRSKNKTFVVKRKRTGVKEASLEYWKISSAKIGSEIFTLVKVILHTGRTHQIRVQFASRKMPIAGDRKYGSKYNCKLALKSFKISYDDLNKSRKEYMNIRYEGTPWNYFSEDIKKILKY